ncbi:MAG: hypothetical protein ACK5ME_04440 [Parahaliea sp.]
MDTQCNPAQLEFPALGRRDVVGTSMAAGLPPMAVGCCCGRSIIV